MIDLETLQLEYPKKMFCDLKKAISLNNAAEKYCKLLSEKLNPSFVKSIVSIKMENL